MTSRSRPLVASLAIALLGAVTGCGEDKCPDHSSDPPTQIPNDDGHLTDLESLIYESAPWGGELTPFTPATPFAFIHGLGHTPEIVSTYVSFSKNGTEGSNLSENAGNQGLIKCVDSEAIVVMNDTCEPNLFIRVVAMASGRDDPAAMTGEKCVPEPEAP